MKKLMTHWIERVREGDLAAIPEECSFQETCELALLLDGYAVAGGTMKCMEISNRIAEEVRTTGQTRAPALDLWIALFGQQRAHRMSGGYALTKEEKFVFDRLVALLRLALVKLTPKQRAGIMSAIRQRNDPGP